MKTIEEKAKAYDEAIKKAAALYKASEPMSGCNVIIETLFPELAESEDEKIKNRLIKLIKMSNEVGGFALHKWEADEMLTWLDKQGEKKPADSYCQENCKGFQETGKCFADGECKAKREAEQESAWSEEDEKFLRRATNAAKDVYPMTANWLKSLKTRYTWKPSDKQLEALKNAIHIKPFENPSDSILWGLYEQLNKLKS